MKTKITLTADTRPLDSFTESELKDQYIGALFPNKQKGFVMAVPNYNTGPYKLMAINSITQGNAFGYGAETLMELLALVLTDTPHVFVFDTYSELCYWLMQKD